jgi:hypothetical protein
MSRNKSEHEDILTDVIIIFIFACITAALYINVFNSYWLYDDPYLLRNLTEHKIQHFFTDPEVWKKISVSNLTPWIMLSYGLDFSLSGLNNGVFFAHHLISLWLASSALYLVLRLWLRPLWAASASLIFLVNAPTAAAAEMLMTRHYIEGLLLFLSAFYFYVKSAREKSIKYSLFSAVLYFLSMSAKEIYVPMIMVFAAFPEGSPGRRIRAIFPLIIAFILYVLWRIYMLGGFITGPGKSILLSSYKSFGAAFQLPEQVSGFIMMMSGTTKISNFVHPFIVISSAVFIILSFFFLLKSKNFKAISFQIILFVSVYFIPLSVINPHSALYDITQYRIAFLTAAYNSIALALAAGFIYEHTKKKIPTFSSLALSKIVPFVFSCVIVMTCISSYLWIRNEREVTLKPLVKEGSFFMNSDNSHLLVKSNPLWGGVFYYENLDFLRQYYQLGSPPLVIYNYFAFIDDPEAQELKGLKVFRYDAVKGSLSDITSSFFQERFNYLSRIRKMPLRVVMHVDDAVLSYSMGPSDTGNYFALLGIKPGTYCMMLQGRDFTPMSLFKSLRFYVRFGWESAEGWVTFSPEWFVDFHKDSEIIWERD